MRKEEINVYRFEELSREAKDRAKMESKSLFGYAWGEEALASLKALAEHFSATLTNYEIDWTGSVCHSGATFDANDLEEEDLAERVNSLGSFNPETGKGLGDCVLTGFGGDEDAIDGLRQAYLKGERDLNALLQAGFRSWLDASQSDYKAQYEDENFAEYSDCNDFEYLENGEFFRK